MSARASLRSASFRTNAVKHFRYTPRGERIHQSLTRWQIAKCQPGLLGAVRPRTVLLTGHRPDMVVATVHPAAVLRARERDDLYAGLLADLRTLTSGLGPLREERP